MTLLENHHPVAEAVQSRSPAIRGDRRISRQRCRQLPDYRPHFLQTNPRLPLVAVNDAAATGLGDHLAVAPPRNMDPRRPHSSTSWTVSRAAERRNTRYFTKRRLGDDELN